MSMFYGGLGELLGNTSAMRFGYDFQLMAAQRMGHGLEPIDWPTIIANQFRAIASTRPLNIWEQCMYDGAIQKIKDAKKV